MTAIFGTDGIRGTVNQYPMTPEMILKIGMAVGIYLKDEAAKLHLDSSTNSIDDNSSKNISVLIGKDTRISGYLVEQTLTSGVMSVGVNVVLIGPTPTSSIPFLLKKNNLSFGIMITASHNQYCDNGLKFFDNDGYKLSCEVENIIFEIIQKIAYNQIASVNALNNILCAERNAKKSDRLDCGVHVLQAAIEPYLVTHDEIGKASRLLPAYDQYVNHVVDVFEDVKDVFQNIKVTIDCANGASYKVMQDIAKILSMDAVFIGCNPDGLNINKTGSTNTEAITKAVVENGSDLGIAFDGDGDRLLICDQYGVIVSGDHLIALLARYLKYRNLLSKDSVVITCLSNNALTRYLSNYGVNSVVLDKIGDRNISIEMRKHGYVFGAEQSGHMIFADHSTTADGIISGLYVLCALRAFDMKVSDINHLFPLTPQFSVNVPINGSDPLSDSRVNENINKIKSVNADLKILVRKSGTEKTVRISVEGESFQKIQGIACEIEQMIKMI